MSPELRLCFDPLFSTTFKKPDCSNCNNSGLSDEGRRKKRPILLYSQARKQSMLKETLSREMEEPGPGPFSELNCSQNLQRDTSVLTMLQSLPITSEICDERPRRTGGAASFQLCSRVHVDKFSSLVLVYEIFL